MLIKIVKQEEQPLLSRKIVILTVGFEGATPSREQLRTEIAKELRVGPDLLILKSIYTTYGHAEAKVTAHVYSKKEDIEEIEQASAIERHKPKEKAEKEEKPAEEKPKEAEKKPEEKPKEEKPVEKKEEKKKESK